MVQVIPVGARMVLVICMSCMYRSRCKDGIIGITNESVMIMQPAWPSTWELEELEPSIVCGRRVQT